jgi:hypothetical protein
MRWGGVEAADVRINELFVWASIQGFRLWRSSHHLMLLGH